MGGNAIKHVSRIKQENVQPTLNAIYKELIKWIGLRKEDTAVLGSTGKKLPGGSSGDIDLAVDLNAIEEQHGSIDNWVESVIDFCNSYGVSKPDLHGFKGLSYNWMKGLKILSIGWPIESNSEATDQEGELVQLDLMPVRNLEMTSWGMYSPHESEEPYKGLVRNELLYAISSVGSYKALKQSINDITGETIDDEYERTVLNNLTGLTYIRQSYISPKTGKRTNTKRTLISKLVEDRPDEIAKILLGPDCKASDVLTAKAVIDKIMAPDFKFKSKRREIIEMAVRNIKRKGVAYPAILDEYLKGGAVSEQEEIDTPRIPMTKIHQMKASEFVEFLKLLKSKLKGNKLDLSDLNTSEKVDGQAVRIIVNDGKIGLESSHSGVQYKPWKLPQTSFTNILKYFQKELSEEMAHLEAQFGMGFKVIGELFYTNDLDIIDDDGSVTFVGTKYDNAKLGTMGAIILFGAQGIKNGKLFDLDESKAARVIKAIKNLSNDTLKIFDSDNFVWKQTLELQINYDTPDVRDIFENPEQLLERSNKKVFQDFRDMIAKAFSDEITKNGSVLGVPGSVVEGIVFQIGDKKYGATNFDWKKVKAHNDRYQTEFEETLYGFFKNVFGFQQLRKIQSLLAEPDADEIYEDKWAQGLPGMKFKLDQIMDEFSKDNSLPKKVKQNLGFFLGNTYKAVQNFDSTLDSLRMWLNKRVKPLKSTK